MQTNSMACCVIPCLRPRMINIICGSCSCRLSGYISCKEVVILFDEHCRSISCTLIVTRRLRSIIFSSCISNDSLNVIDDLFAAWKNSLIHISIVVICGCSTSRDLRRIIRLRKAIESIVAPWYLWRREYFSKPSYLTILASWIVLLSTIIETKQFSCTCSYLILI